MGLLNTINKWFNNQNRVPVLFDSSALHDPIANNTSWLPLKKGGSNFTTRNLKFSRDRYAEITPSKSIYAFWILFSIAGIAAAGHQFYNWSNTKEIEEPLALAVGVIFSCIGLVGFINEMKYRVLFDKQTDTFYHQSMGDSLIPFRINTRLTPLKEIHALQIIKERIESDDIDNDDYHSYEMNIVLKDGARINVLDHGNGELVLSDGKKLADFLDVKFWDASDFKV